MTMKKWSITLRGHTAIVAIEPDATGDAFAGTVESSEYGTAPITDGKIGANGIYTGNVTLNGTNARLEATIGGGGYLTGVVHIGWFISVPFVGAPVTAK
jgi:hypothetical protein